MKALRRVYCCISMRSWRRPADPYLRSGRQCHATTEWECERGILIPPGKETGMRSAGKRGWIVGVAVVISSWAGLRAIPACAETGSTHLQDRGSGMPTSMSGTYVRKGELL